MVGTKVVVALAVVVVGALCATAALADSSLANGGFEGSLGGWSTEVIGGGDWSANPGVFDPSGCATGELHGPVVGATDALWDMDNAAAGVLYQKAVVPKGGVLSFLMEYENDAGGWAITGGNEFNTGSLNQWLSVDVLRGDADPATFDPSQILANAFQQTSGSSALVKGWSRHELDLSRFAGQTVIVRFAVADTQDCLPVAIDDVSLNGPTSRLAYCSVAGDTWPDGTAIPPGTFLDLQEAQPSWDADYTGAQLATFVSGKGLTCDPPPAGYTQQGMYEGPGTADGVYPYYATAPSAP